MTYCKHGFCEGIFNCEYFMPINGSAMCVYGEVGGKCQLYKSFVMKRITNCINNDYYFLIDYWERKLKKIDTVDGNMDE
jgi:hypothetical protein